MTLRQRLNKWVNFLEDKDNFKQAPGENNNKTNPALRRQTKTVSLILEAYMSHKPGLILADDVGLGKTWVGILVALAFASRGGKVIISLPNMIIRNKWADELEKWYGDDPHPDLYDIENEIVRHPYDVDIIWGSYQIDYERLQDGLIMLLTHSQFKDENLRATPWNCDLLIVDEAHRGKDKTEFNKRDESDFRLFLTATPFGKDIETLLTMLEAIGCEDENVEASIRDFKEKQENYSKYQKITGEELMESLSKCQESLQPWLIRHDLDNVSKEEKENIGSPVYILGNLKPPEEIDNKINNNISRLDLDPINVDESTARMLLHAQRLKQLKALEGTEYSNSSTLMAPISTTAFKDIVKKLKVDNSPKLEDPRINYHFEGLSNYLEKPEKLKQEALKAFAKNCFEQNEKFIVFCYYLKTADEVHNILKEAYDGFQAGKINNKVEKNELKKLDDDEDPSISGQIRSIPEIKQKEANIRNLFNSPCHPQALVLTSEHSEGIDLHLRCRILVHYELTYRPEHLLQANGRIRRVGSWSGKTGKPILYYYPYLKGTRDESLSKVVLNRADTFGKLMGGLPDLSIDNQGFENEKFSKYKQISFDNKAYKKISDVNNKIKQKY